MKTREKEKKLKPFDLEKIYSDLSKNPNEENFLNYFSDLIQNSKNQNIIQKNSQNPYLQPPPKKNSSKKDKNKNQNPNLIWEIISPNFKPVDDEKLFSSVLVPSFLPLQKPRTIIPFPKDNFNNSQNLTNQNWKKSPKSKRVSYTSILLSALVFLGEPVDIVTKQKIQQIPNQNSFSNEIKLDEDYMNLDIDTKILLEIEYVGLGNGSLHTISPDLLNEYEKIHQEYLVAVGEANLVKDKIVSELMKKKEEIQHYNYLCNCINSIKK